MKKVLTRYIPTSKNGDNYKFVHDTIIHNNQN